MRHLLLFTLFFVGTLSAAEPVVVEIHSSDATESYVLRSTSVGTAYIHYEICRVAPPNECLKNEFTKTAYDRATAGWVIHRLENEVRTMSTHDYRLAIAGTTGFFAGATVGAHVLPRWMWRTYGGIVKKGRTGLLLGAIGGVGATGIMYWINWSSAKQTWLEMFRALSLEEGRSYTYTFDGSVRVLAQRFAAELRKEDTYRKD